MHKKNIIISIISVFFLVLFFFSGCNPESIEITAENTSGQSNGSTSSEKQDSASNITEESDQEVSTSESSAEISAETEEPENAEGSGDENPNLVKYKDIKVEIAQLYTIYAELHTSTVSLNIDTETGLIDGYILLGYNDTRPVENSRVECASSLKGAISGSFDAGTGELEGKIVGEIDADGELCFSDGIESNLTLTLIEDGEYIEGSFKVPVYTQFDFLLQKIN
jgi:hypothetical protein